MPTDKMKQRVNALEKRIAKLEKAAALFEEHRQAWINLNKSLKKMKQEMDREKRQQLKREKRLKDPDRSGASSLFARIEDIAR